MKIQNYHETKSSFLSIEKDLDIIIDKILSNRRLQKLLYYTTPDALNRPELTDKQKGELFKNNIKIVPKLYVDGSVFNYIIISFDNFITNFENPEFRDNTIIFDIVCHFDQWNLDGIKLRPFAIAAELDYMLHNQKLTGIGELHFAGAKQVVLTDEFAGLTLMYEAIHGEEDRKNMLNPEDQKQYELDFKDMIKKNLEFKPR